MADDAGEGVSEDSHAERERLIEEAIRGANLKDSHREHFRNLLDRLERDDEALIVLKGHLVIEERITAAIEKFVWHAEFVEGARLNFATKVQLARAISMDHHQNTIWDLIDKLNAVRNKLAHTLDGEPRAKAMTALREAFKREVPNAPKEELEDDGSPACECGLPLPWVDAHLRAGGRAVQGLCPHHGPRD